MLVLQDAPLPVISYKKKNSTCRGYNPSSPFIRPFILWVITPCITGFWGPTLYISIRKCTFFGDMFSVKLSI